MVLNPHDSTQQTHEYLPQSLIYPTPQVNEEIPCWHNYKEEKQGKAGIDKDQAEISAPLKFGEINENTREEIIIRTRKDLFGLI